VNTQLDWLGQNFWPVDISKEIFDNYSQSNDNKKKEAKRFQRVSRSAEENAKSEVYSQ